MPSEITNLIELLKTQGLWAFIAALVRTLLSIFDGQHWIKKVVAATSTFFIGVLGASIAGSIESLQEYQTSITILFTIFGYDFLRWILKDPQAAWSIVKGFIPWGRRNV